MQSLKYAVAFSQTKWQLSSFIVSDLNLFGLVVIPASSSPSLGDCGRAAAAAAAAGRGSQEVSVG